MKKSENGSLFPASAYAYAPDLHDPDTWKLRLWESGRGLDPVRVAAVQTLLQEDTHGVPVEALPSVRAKVASAAQKLAESTQRCAWTEAAAIQAVGENRTAIVQVIQPGFNASKKRFYPKETIAEAARLFDGVKMFANHATQSESETRPEGDIQQWVGVLRNPVVEANGAVTATATIIDPMFREKLTALREADMLHEMGVSIRGGGETIPRTIDGVLTNYVTRIAVIESVDFVTRPGAGGHVMLFEADVMNALTVESLTESRPDLVAALTEQGGDPMELKEMEARLAALEEAGKASAATIKALEIERDALKVQIEEAGRKEALSAAQAKIAEAISKSDLPQAAKDRLSESLKGAGTADGIEGIIEAERAYLAKLTESGGRIEGFGGGKAEDKTETKSLVEVLTESYRRRGYSEAVAKQRAELAAK